MKYFGGFLVDKELITPEQLVDALLEQAQYTPSSITILYRNGSLSTQEVLSVLKLQDESHGDLRTTCIKLGVWKESYVGILQSEMLDKRPKLGQILINKCGVSPIALLNCLKDFQLETIEGGEIIEKNCPKESKEPKEEKGSIESSCSSSEYKPVFVDIEKESVIDYLDLFSIEKRDKLENDILNVEHLKNGNEIASDCYEALDSFYRDYHSIKGAARLVGAVLTENLVHDAEELLSFFKRFTEKVEKDDFIYLSEINLRVLDMIWELREGLARYATEEKLWDDNASKRRYQSLLMGLKKMLSQMQTRGYEVSLEEVSNLF